MRDVQVMRVETDCGEATLILADGFVEHASPAIIWALWLPRAKLLRHLAARDLCADVVVAVAGGRRGRYRLEPAR